MAVSVYKFGDFKLDCDRFELYRAGRSLKLERKPMELLVLLATRNGNLVTRTEIAEHLWGREVFVDTEHGINTAIRKIREILNDDPVQSRFVQTVTGKGYRLIGSIIEVPVEAVTSTAQQSDQSSSSRNRRVGDINPPPPPAGAVAIQDLPTPNEDPPPQPPASPSKDQPPPFRNSRVLVWLLGSAVLVLLILAVTLGARILRNRLHPTAPKITSLAVLPLDNLSGDPAQNYFADGMTDELTTMLAKNSTLRIVSRTSVMQYKGAHRPLPEIARELGVDGILEGSISRSGDNVHMTIQLIQAPTDTHLWAESYDRNANDVVTLPNEAAQAIAKRLGGATLQPASARYVNPEAHDAYLRGRYIWFQGDNEAAGKYFRRAIELQPDYAPGWAGLATYYGQGTFYDLDPRVANPKASEAAKKAVELDPSLPWAHLALGASMFFDWNWPQAEQEIERAIELNPDFAEPYHFRAKVLNAFGRNSEAIESEKKAMELDPFERPFGMALALNFSRQYDAAIDDVRSRLEGTPQDAMLHWMLCEAYRRKGDLKQAAKEWETGMLLSGNKEEAENIRLTYEKGGYQALLLRQVANFKKQSATQYVSPMQFALQYAQLGRRDETLASLEEARQQHAPDLLWVQNDPAYDFLHSDERYRAIIKATGLPPKY